MRSYRISMPALCAGQDVLTRMRRTSMPTRKTSVGKRLQGMLHRRHVVNTPFSICAVASPITEKPGTETNEHDRLARMLDTDEHLDNVQDQHASVASATSDAAADQLGQPARYRPRIISTRPRDARESREALRMSFDAVEQPQPSSMLEYTQEQHAVAQAQGMSVGDHNTLRTQFQQLSSGAEHADTDRAFIAERSGNGNKTATAVHGTNRQIDRQQHRQMDQQREPSKAYRRNTPVYLASQTIERFMGELKAEYDMHQAAQRDMPEEPFMPRSPIARLAMARGLDFSRLPNSRRFAMRMTPAQLLQIAAAVGSLCGPPGEAAHAVQHEDEEDENSVAMTRGGSAAQGKDPGQQVSNGSTVLSALPAATSHQSTGSCAKLDCEEDAAAAQLLREGLPMEMAAELHVAVLRLLNHVLQYRTLQDGVSRETYTLHPAQAIKLLSTMQMSGSSAVLRRMWRNAQAQEHGSQAGSLAVGDNVQQPSHDARAAAVDSDVHVGTRASAVVPLNRPQVSAQMPAQTLGQLDGQQQQQQQLDMHAAAQQQQQPGTQQQQWQQQGEARAGVGHTPSWWEGETSPCNCLQKVVSSALQQAAPVQATQLLLNWFQLGVYTDALLERNVHSALAVLRHALAHELQQQHGPSHAEQDAVQTAEQTAEPKGQGWPESQAKLRDLAVALGQLLRALADMRPVPRGVQIHRLPNLFQALVPYMSARDLNDNIRRLLYLKADIRPEVLSDWGAAVSSHYVKSSAMQAYRSMLLAASLPQVPSTLDAAALAKALEPGYEYFHAPMMATVCDLLPAVSPSGPPAGMDIAALGTALNRAVPRMTGDQLGTTLRGLAKLGCLPYTLDWELLGTCLTKAASSPECHHRDLMTMVHYVTVLEQPPSTLAIDVVLSRLSSQLDALGPLDLVRFLRSLSALKEKMGRAFVEHLDMQALARIINKHVVILEAPELASLSLSLSYLHTVPEGFDMDAFRAAVEAKTDEFEPADLRKTLAWIVANRQWLSLDDTHEAKKTLLQEPERLHAREVTMLLSAIAHQPAEYTKDDYQRLVLAACDKLEQCTPRTLSSAIWSMAKLDAIPLDFDWNKVDSLLRPNVDKLRTNELCGLFVSLANVFGTNALVNQHKQAEAASTDEEGKAEDGEDSAHPSRRTRTRPPLSFFVEIQSELVGRKELPQYLSSWLWSSSQLKLRPGSHLHVAVESALPASLSHSPHAISAMLLGVAKLRIRVHIKQLKCAMNGLMEQLPAYDASTQVHHISLACWSVTCILARHPHILVAMLPKLQQLLRMLPPDVPLSAADAGQLLIAHHTIRLVLSGHSSTQAALMGKKQFGKFKNGGPGQASTGGAPDADALASCGDDLLLSEAQVVHLRGCLPEEMPGFVRHFHTTLGAAAREVPNLTAVEQDVSLLDATVCVPLVLSTSSGQQVAIVSLRGPRYINGYPLAEDGQAILRNELLKWLGYHVIEVFEPEWYKLADQQDRVAYLHKQLQSVVFSE